jgi:hypothetical protein
VATASAPDRVASELAVGERRDATSRSRLVVIAAIALTVVALLPILVTVVVQWGRHYVPIGDYALIDLRTRDVWSRDIPLVGAYSRYGWNHPGPLEFWLVAPFSLLTGRGAWATQVGNALLQGVAIVWLARFCWRRGGLPLLSAGLAAVSLSYAGTGSWIFLEPWNPHVAYPFFVLFAFQLWAIADNDPNRLLGSAVVATFLVQAHVGYLPLVVVGYAAALVARFRSDGVRMFGGREIRNTAIVTALLWFPAMLDPLVHRPASLPRLVRYFVFGGNDPQVGVRKGAGLLAAEFRILPPWLGGKNFVESFNGAARPVSVAWMLVPAAVLGVGAVVAWRRRETSSLHFIGIIAALCAAGLVALTRVAEPAFAYLFYWRIELAVLTAVAGVWLVMHTLQRRMRHVMTAGTALLAFLIAYGSIPLATDVARDHNKPDRFQLTAEAFMKHIEDRHLLTKPVIIRRFGSPLGGVEAALVNELDRADYPVRVDKDRGFQFGYSRTASLDDVGEVWYVIEDGEYLSSITTNPHARVIAFTSPLSSNEESEARALQREIGAQLHAARRDNLIPQLHSSLLMFALPGVPGVDGRAVARLGAINAKVNASGRCRCAVVALPSHDVAPEP